MFSFYAAWLNKLKYLKQSLFSKLASWHIEGMSNFTLHVMSSHVTRYDQYLREWRRERKDLNLNQKFPHKEPFLKTFSIFSFPHVCVGKKGHLISEVWQILPLLHMFNL